MPKRSHVLGKKFHRLTVIGDAESATRHRRVLVRCECETEKVVLLQALSSGDVKSCGCLWSELDHKAYNTTRTHGLRRTAEYNIWSKMRQRCQNPKNPAYADYGGRGITVDPSWESFENFYADMGPRPDPSLTLDRVDNSKGYGPTNCAWRTRDEQAQNTRWNSLNPDSVRLIRSQVAAGVPQVEIARSLGVTPNAVCCVVKRKTWKNIP